MTSDKCLPCMAANNFLSSQETRLRGSGKSYGDTVVKYGAHAHLGDISQDLNIQGDLHLHFQTPLGVISIADAVVSLVQTIDTLQTLGSQIQQIEEENEKRLRLGKRIKRRISKNGLEYLRVSLAALPSNLSRLEVGGSLWICHSSEKVCT